MNADQAIHQLRAVIRRQHKALATEAAYVSWLRRYMDAVQRFPETLTSEQKLECFLTDLARNRDISASSQNQAFNAVVYFYKDVLGRPLQGVDALRATRPVRIRTAPSVADTQALLKTIRNVGGHPTNLIAKLLYGCGLRVSEPLNLRIKDIDFQRCRLSIRGAKGGKDRVVAMPATLIPEIAQQVDVAQATWNRDRLNGIPVTLPEGLARKYPDFQFAWKWAWLFPAHTPRPHPRTGVLVRYRMHEANVQRAVKHARRQLGIGVLPHELRHGYATHCPERGANPRAIQEAMGHASLETTMGYLHAESLSVRSPLEALEATPLSFGPPGYGNRQPVTNGLGRAYEPVRKLADIAGSGHSTELDAYHGDMNPGGDRLRERAFNPIGRSAAGPRPAAGTPGFDPAPRRASGGPWQGRHRADGARAGMIARPRHGCQADRPQTPEAGAGRSHDQRTPAGMRCLRPGAGELDPGVRCSPRRASGEPGRGHQRADGSRPGDPTAALSRGSSGATVELKLGARNPKH